MAPRVQGRVIGTALVARASEILREAGTRTCHIGWTTRESFYRRAGYRPWRRYAMFSRPAWPGPAGHIRHSRNDRRFLRSPSAAPRLWNTCIGDRSGPVTENERRALARRYLGLS